MKRPTEKDMHFAPTVRRVERNGRWHPGFSEVDRRGQPLFPHYTKAEAEAHAERMRCRPVFHKSYADARMAAIVLPGE